MNFEKSQAYLFSLGNEVETMKLGLENIARLLAELGDPQNNFKKVQVAGTNGKGSVCAFLDSICRAAKIRVGLFTSPHLISIKERIKVNGEDISEADFARLATKVRGRSEELVARRELETVPTYFEQVTAIGLLAFAEAGVELAILETGLGGRYDAVTAAGAEVVAITRIDLDHQRYLGDTIGAIAAEKAAIIHSGSSVVVGDQFDAALDVIVRRCSEVGVEPVWARDTEVPNVRLGLEGRHQMENARIAIALAAELGRSFPISEENIASGLAEARHPGRLERVGRFLLDGAHNPSGVRALCAFLDEYVRGPVTLIFGVMGDKDVGEMTAELFPRARHIILTKPANSRSMETSELAGYVPAGFDPTRVRVAESTADALAMAIETAEVDSTILIAGSLYLVGEARQLLNN